MNTTERAGRFDLAAEGPRLLMPDHDEEIERLACRLREVAFADDRAELVEHYRHFETAVAEHIAAEEELILPAYERYAPEDAHHIRTQHAALQTQILGLAVDVELHAVRIAQLDRLIEALRAHARHESFSMYPWAEANLRLQPRRELLARIGRSLGGITRHRRLTEDRAR